ncbi:MAG: sugar kinase [Phycisphaerae bacterium]|nr:sugar kinase [Phycisphaerae bacterium]
MSLLVTGTIGIDTLETPFGQASDVLGGSAVHFSLAASLLAPVRFVGVVGEDFPGGYRTLLAERNIDLAGLETRAGSKTFRWSGKYIGDMNEAETLQIDLNVLTEAAPPVPATFKDTPCVFLAATHPGIQSAFIDQLTAARLIVADTRDFWIESQRDALVTTLRKVHGAILNDGEARLLTGEINLIVAGRKILQYGPRFVVIKKGEHGAMLVTADRVFAIAAYPTTDVKDPTGAGDSFAGGMMGYLATRETFGFDELKRALARGTITASYTIEDFGPARIRSITRDDIEKRLAEFAAAMRFD